MGLRKFSLSIQDSTQEVAVGLDVHDVQQALTVANATIRRQSIWQAQLSPQVVQLLCAHVLQEADEHVLEALFVALARSRDPQVVIPMLNLLESEDALLRNRALEVLALHPQAALSQIAQRFTDADSDARIFMVNLMTDLHHADVLPWLVQALQQESHVNVVGALIEVLTEVADARAVPALQQVQQRFADEPFVAFAAQMALERIGAA